MQLVGQRCIVIWVALLFLILPAQGQTIEFLASPDLPDGIAVEVLTSAGDTSPTVVQPCSKGWCYGVAPPASGRRELTFLVLIPERDDPEGISADAMQVQMTFSISAMEPTETIEVPIVLFRSTSSTFLEQIDNLPEHQIYQKIQFGQQLALHFASRLPSRQDALTQRMMQVWFDSLHRAIVMQRRPLRMPRDIMERIRASFANDQRKLNYFTTMFDDQQSFVSLDE